MSKSFRKSRAGEKKLLEETLTTTAKQFQGVNGVQRFIEAVLTDGERYTIARRLTIARYMLSGYNQPQINEKLGVSPNTFGKIRLWLEDELPNYNKVLEAISEQENQKNVQLRDTKTSPGGLITFETLRKKYPGHFLLFNLAEEILTLLDKKS